MSTPIKNYILNDVQEPPDWSQRERTLLEAIIGKLPDANETLVVDEHRHEKLMNDAETRAVVYSEGDDLMIRPVNDVILFSDSVEGDTKEVEIYGFRAGDVARRVSIGVGVDAADTLSMDNITTLYWAGSRIGINTTTPNAAPSVNLSGSILGIDGNGDNAGVLLNTQGNDDAAIHFIDDNAAANTKWIRWYMDGADPQKIRAQALNDAGSAKSTDIIVIDGVNNIVTFGNGTHVADDIQMQFGGAVGGPDVRVHWDTSQTPDAFHIHIDQSGDFLITIDSGDASIKLGNASSDFEIFPDVASGFTQEVEISGFRSGDALRTLRIGVGVDANDTASFSGLTDYQFNGSITVTSDISRDDFQSYVATEVGWSGTPTQECYYKRVGKTVHAWLKVTGESDNSLTTLSLPVNPDSSYDTAVAGHVFGFSRNVDDTTNEYIGYCTRTSGNLLNIYRDASNNNWTASGTKTVSAYVCYEGV